MKYFTIPLLLLALLTGCTAPKASLITYTPDPTQSAKENPYNNYNAGMSRDGKSPLAADWQVDQKAKLATAVTPEALAKFVASAEAADALLAQVKPAYQTDPIVATQIAVITTRVMDADKDAERKIWASALLKAAQTATDPYRTCYFLDQLRWCGCPCQSSAICQIRRQTPYQEVAQLCTVVLTELKR